jgi:chromosome partitioning protein
MPAFTIAMLNQKGGVGKTSTCHHLGGTLARAGRRVLLIDADPQASLTQGIWGPDQTRNTPREHTIAALFDDALDPAPGDVIAPTRFPGIHLVPGSDHLTAFNLPEPERDRRQGAIRDLVGEVRSQYDVILIDCPPNIQLCSWAALMACDGLVVPLQAEDYGAQGIAKIQQAVAMAKAGPNPHMRLLGYLITMFNKSLAIHVAYAGNLRALYGDQVFATVVPLAKDYKEAVAARLPVAEYKPRSAAAKAIAALADELLARVGEGADARRVA